MANSRKSGDCLEYNIVEILVNGFNFSFYDKKSEDKFNKLKTKITNPDCNLSVKSLSKLFKDININTYNKIKFTQDNDGKKGNVSDFELYGSNDGYNTDNIKNHDIIGFSLKKNNISIKHPRPSAFNKQSNLNEANSIKYKEDYLKCNIKWYEKIKILETFNKIKALDKEQLYLDFNNNTKKYLEKLNSEEVKAFWKFLINYNKVYIVKYDTKKKQIILYDYLTTPDPKLINSIEVKGNHIIISFDNGINIDLRLHNASKSITKSLSLKYDTKILNNDKIFTQTIYELS